MLQFDENGYLTPYGPIESNLETLEEVFIAKNSLKNICLLSKL